jgi:4-nitrophenyl phosphatase
MYYLALERLSLSPGETLVVGDRLETDIAGAQKACCPAALVLSGVTSFEAAQRWTPAPDIISTDLSSVLELLQSF